jgi:hypothetical protein
MSVELLTRDQFREGVFARDRHRCVVCQEPAQDSHHIIERRLWGDGGYYLDNGASVCERHHLAAEATLIDCERLRELCGIRQILLPEHLYADQRYDKWGNPILDNGQRLRGELFDDESVQKILAPVLHLFTNRVKYARTYHLPWSPGVTDDDRVVGDADELFGGKDVVVTVKLDGENTTMYRDYIHARSLEFTPHASRNRARALHGSIAHDIPEGWRVCGENLYAKHTIHYKKLPAHFLVFSVWNEKNVCLPWDETLTWAELLGLKVVPVLYRGPWDEMKVRACHQPTFDGEECEGYVVRVAGEFHYREFRRCAAKYVRAGHVPVHGGHWANRVVVPNELAEGASP